MFIHPFFHLFVFICLFLCSLMPSLVLTECIYLRKKKKKKKKKKKRTRHMQDSFCITKTCLYNFDPLKPHFYIVKLGFAGVYIIFVISAKNINYGHSVPPRRGSSNEYPQSMF